MKRELKTEGEDDFISKDRLKRTLQTSYNIYKIKLEDAKDRGMHFTESSHHGSIVAIIRLAEILKIEIDKY